MVEMITQVNNAINGVVWGPFGLALLFCTGFWMSARTGFFQFRKMGYWLRHTIGVVLHPGQSLRAEGGGPVEELVYRSTNAHESQPAICPGHSRH